MAQLIVNGNEVSSSSNKASNIKYKEETVETALNNLNENLTTFHYRKLDDGTRQISDDGETWENFSKGTVKELLWVNPSPTSAFAAQTISLDLSDYEAVLIITNWSTVDPYLYPETITMLTTNDDMSANIYHKLGNTVSSSNDRYLRMAKVDKTGVWFSDGINGSGAGDNKIGVPQKIYGLKQGIPSYNGELYYNYYSANVSFIVPANTLCIIGGTLAGSSISGDYFTLFDVISGGYYGMKYIQTVSDVNITVGANKDIGIIVDKKFW